MIYDYAKGKLGKGTKAKTDIAEGAGLLIDNLWGVQ